MADDEQFSLCWNNFNTNLSAGFHESLCRGDLVDVTLAAEGQLVKAHRLVLSVCSPYFRKMFTQMPANQHAFVFLKDVSHSALKDLIQFMYCGEVNVKQDALPAFISTAEALQIKGLTENGDGPSAPAPHPSPAKESTIVHSTPAAPHPVASSRVGQKIVQRGRVQSYKVESEESSDEKAQTVHVQPTPVAQKRTIARTITPSSTPVMKRAKITTTADPLEASEPTVQTIQIVKNVPSSEPEYVEMPIETINPKSEPEYVEDTAVIEGTDQEHDDTETHEIHETEEGQYVEDESYGDMKYDESYFTEGDDTKAGASGFGESYAEGADQSASEAQVGNSLMTKLRNRIHALKSIPFDLGDEESFTIQQQIYHLDKTLKVLETRACSKSTNTVDGFDFPLSTQQEIEKLEETVKADKEIKKQYIDYLITKKPLDKSVSSLMPELFTDNALDHYNYNGFAEKKRAMKRYEIFTNCMMAAWSDFINEETLRANLKEAIIKSQGRMRQKRFRQRKSANASYAEYEIVEFKQD